MHHEHSHWCNVTSYSSRTEQQHRRYMNARLWVGALPSDGHLHVFAVVSKFILSRLIEFGPENKGYPACTVPAAFDMLDDLCHCILAYTLTVQVLHV